MSNTTKIILGLLTILVVALVAYLIESIELFTLKSIAVTIFCAITGVAIYHAVAKASSFLDEEGELSFNKTTTTTEEAEVEYTQKTLKEFFVEEDFADENISKINGYAAYPAKPTRQPEPDIVPYVGNIHGENLENKKRGEDDGVSIDRLRKIIEEESKKPKRKSSKPRTKKTIADGK